MTDVFSREGVEIMCDCRAERAWQDDDGIHVAAAGRELGGDALLVATGRLMLKLMQWRRGF